ncbi:unnamed protein product [Pieris macdunnoughi]|uniref:Sm domain-containing protein n=1 Tax=Pieris macdunnoughi TaxID=345717 RepID=A0A821R665_9NEOP|nr:unnamed protein product [Pieris macdunnoughi]
MIVAGLEINITLIPFVPWACRKIECNFTITGSDDLNCKHQIITRNDTGIRGYLQANVIAFDKQWNLALTDVLEVWKRKGPRKRKVPPGLGTPVRKGTAAAISPIPVVTEKPLGGGIWECSRHIPQLMVRGEHIVIINIVER